MPVHHAQSGSVPELGDGRFCPAGPDSTLGSAVHIADPMAINGRPDNRLRKVVVRAPFGPVREHCNQLRNDTGDRERVAAEADNQHGRGGL